MEWKISPLWGFCKSSNHLYRSIKDVSYTGTRPSTVFCFETWSCHTGVDEDYVLSTGEGLRTFRWNAEPSSWTAGPEEVGKLTSWQGETFQMTWNLTCHDHLDLNHSCMRLCSALGSHVKIGAIIGHNKHVLSMKTKCQVPLFQSINRFSSSSTNISIYHVLIMPRVLHIFAP